MRLVQVCPVARHDVLHVCQGERAGPVWYPVCVRVRAWVFTAARHRLLLLLLERLLCTPSWPIAAVVPRVTRCLPRRVHSLTHGCLLLSPQGPDFTSKFTVDCWRYCCCSCLDVCETCCTCAQMCGKRHEILDTAGTPLGRIVHPTCWEYCCSCLFPGKARILLKTLTPDGQQKYIVR